MLMMFRDDIGNKYVYLYIRFHNDLIYAGAG